MQEANLPLSWIPAEPKDMAERLADLRRLLDEDQPTFGKRFGRGRKQVSNWENVRQLPRPAVLEQAASQNGWPIEIFAKGGPMPSDVLGRKAFAAAVDDMLNQAKQSSNNRSPLLVTPEYFDRLVVERGRQGGVERLRHELLDKLMQWVMTSMDSQGKVDGRHVVVSLGELIHFSTLGFAQASAPTSEREASALDAADISSSPPGSQQAPPGEASG